MTPSYTTTTRSGIHVPTSANNGTDMATGLLQMANEQDGLWFPGMLVAAALSAAPTGWLLCDGATVSRTTYANLFTAVGTTYGNGDGTTTFGIPDLRGRVPVGVDGTAGRLASNDALGQSGGEEKHTLSIAELPAHDHQLDAAGRKIPTGDGSDFALSAWAVGGNNGLIYMVGGTSMSWVKLTQTRGGGTPANVMQPFQVVNYVIKT